MNADAIIEERPNPPPSVGGKKYYAEKRRVIALALADPEWNGLSNNEIARRHGVSNAFVQSVRAECPYPMPDEVAFRTKHGQYAKMRKGNIGKGKLCAAPMPPTLNDIAPPLARRPRPARSGPETPMPDPLKHQTPESFQAETEAATQLARAAAWTLVGLMAERLAAKADAPGRYTEIADAATRAAANRLDAALALAQPADNAHPHEYAPMIALRQLLAAGDRTLALGWNDGIPLGAIDRHRYAFDPLLAEAMRAIEAVDSLPVDLARARQRIEARLVRADGNAVEFDSLRRLTPGLTESDFRRIVGHLRDAELATLTKIDTSIFGKSAVNYCLAATPKLLFPAPSA